MRRRRNLLPGARDHATRLRALALLAMLTAACTSAPPVRSAADHVVIPALRCALDVPAGTAVALTDEGATFTTRPGARVPRTFSVHARPAVAGEVQRVLADDVSIAYSLRTNSGGSGGEEATLVGALRVGDRSFAVTCDDQDEPPGGPDATWCLAWLATARVER